MSLEEINSMDFADTGEKEGGREGKLKNTSGICSE